MRQVYLTLHGVWRDIIHEDEIFIMAEDIDGIVTYVIKDGMQKTRTVD